ncbi:putative glycolipid-binding domain-containing protein [Ruegeria sp. EL01]|uniref:putative glycolipid-binding domain-containing protein n=1 Tax=Ruegeria sp. EL01 TaxID=2107578 RepID=UPI000EA80479|nr:putative glycolipid-binding domain-containing protein [Ruegeria sp. EL01]
MSGRTAIATAHWRRLDVQGTDRCTLSRLDNGWMLVGQATWHENGADNMLTYDVRCAMNWHCLSADVSGEVGGHDVALRLRCTNQGWALNDTLQDCGAECLDLDLSFTPATNLFPMRREEIGQAQSARIKAAWLKPDLVSMERLDQVYTWLSPGLIRYGSTNHQADLSVHPSGFVTHYPGLWEGWIDA